MFQQIFKQLLPHEVVGHGHIGAFVEKLAILVNNFTAKTVKGMNGNIIGIFADNAT